MTGSGVGIEALGSPINAQFTKPPLITILGFAPKNAIGQSTISAIFPASIEPNTWAKPSEMA